MLSRTVEDQWCEANPWPRAPSARASTPSTCSRRRSTSSASSRAGRPCRSSTAASIREGADHRCRAQAAPRRSHTATMWTSLWPLT